MMVGKEWFNEKKKKRENNIYQLQKDIDNLRKTLNVSNEIEDLISLEKKLGKQKGMLIMLRKCYKKLF